MGKYDISEMLLNCLINLQWSLLLNFKDKGHKKTSRNERFYAGWTGLEPATSAVTGRHSNQLNYQPVSL